MSHQKAVSSLLEAIQTLDTKTRLSAVFALIYIDKTGLQLTDDPRLAESMAGVLSRTQSDIDPGWDFETAYILPHIGGQRKVALRSSHADMIAIRYSIAIEDIDQKTGSLLRKRLAIPLQIDSPDAITAAMALAEAEFAKDRGETH